MRSLVLGSLLSIPVAALAGCRRTELPKGGDGSTGSSAPSAVASAPRNPASAPPTTDPSNTPSLRETVDSGTEEDGAYLSGATWLSCLEGFHTGSTVQRDLVRLAMLCGPYHGMKKLTEPVQGTLVLRKSQRSNFELKRDQCYRVFAVAESSVKQLALRAFGTTNKLLVETVSSQSWATLRPQGAFCTSETGIGQVEIEALEGQGAFALQVWVLP